MKGAARDKENMVGLHHPVLGGNGGAFDKRQQVALHALARHIRADRFAAARDLVDFVEKHDAVLLCLGECLGRQGLGVYQGARFLLGEAPESLAAFRWALISPWPAPVLSTAR